jgi:hypothetical protein
MNVASVFQQNELYAIKYKFLVDNRSNQREPVLRGIAQYINGGVRELFGFKKVTAMSASLMVKNPTMEESTTSMFFILVSARKFHTSIVLVNWSFIRFILFHLIDLFLS